MTHRTRRTKILATLGPASSSREMIQNLFEAGADLFRINMSHSSHDTLKELVSIIRSVEEIAGRPIGILADLQGPKLRLGDFAEDAIAVEPGDRITLDLKDTPGDRTRIQLPHPEILEALEVGHRILMDDGKVQVNVVEETPTLDGATTS